MKLIKLSEHPTLTKNEMRKAFIEKGYSASYSGKERGFFITKNKE